ncbi:MAG: hypothetical protein ACI9B9_001998 [Halioglobus sp.]|jgi:hypothetical protein
MSIVKKIRRQLGSSALILCAFTAFSVPASAAFISTGSELAFFGLYQTTGGTNLQDSTGATFPSGVSIAAGAGDFSAAMGGTATFLDFTFNPVTASDILTFAGGGQFSATEMVIDQQSETSIAITMGGLWSINGFDVTGGTLVLTADALAGLYTFSASGVVYANGISPDEEIANVPVPAAIWLFASALGGMGIIKRRRSVS